MLTATYEQLRQAMDHRMLAGDAQRVAKLSAVLHQLGDPDQPFQIIHIAGTNGKGSTGAWLAQALQNAGAVVGHFASPSMVSALAQTKRNGVAITKAQYAEVMTTIMAQADLTPAAFSDFEWDVLVTLVWYAHTGVTWAVLEAGLGGAFDATNAIAAPRVAVFTHIALDHTAILGPTVAAIAANKAAIIKPHTAVVVAPNQDPAALAVLTQAAKARHAASLKLVQAPITATAPTWAGWQAQFAGHTFDLRMLGDFQLDNVRTAWTVWDQLGLPEPAMQAATASVQLPGRMQVVQAAPHVVLDAGHNPDALPKALAMAKQLSAGRLLVVAGFLKDKDVDQLAQALAVADAVWVTTPNHPTRALAGAVLAKLVPEATVAADVHAGLAEALAQARPDDVVLVAGSFYLIGDLYD